MTPETWDKKKLVREIKVSELGVTKKQLGRMTNPELVVLYKKQEAKGKQGVSVKKYNERVLLKNLNEKINRNSKQLVLRQLHIKQRNALIIELGMYANSAYERRQSKTWPNTMCNLKKPNVKAAYDALPWNKHENMNNHYVRVIRVLFNTEQITLCHLRPYEEIYNKSYMHALLSELYKVKSKLAHL